MSHISYLTYHISITMFRQFIDKAIGADVYLITSLWIFLIFFILVTVMLFKMNKDHIRHMSELPLADSEEDKA
jgi:hypothetical protein